MIIIPEEIVKIFESPNFIRKDGFPNNQIIIKNKDIFDKFIKENNLQNTKQVWYLYKNHLPEIPVCKNCGKQLHNFEKGKEYCSYKCAQNSKEVRDKIEETNLKKLGVKSPFASKEIQKKIEETNLKNLGVKNPFASKEIQKKIEETNLKNLGVKNPLQNEDVKKKKEKTFLKHFNVKCNLQDKKIRENQFKTRKENRYEIFLKTIENHYELLDTKEEYINNEIHNYRCLTCGNSFTSEKTNIQLIHCPECIKTYGTSKEEKEVLSWLKSIYNGTIIENDRTILERKELDIYLPEKQLAIEYNGSYWHSAEKKDKFYHQEKTLNCIEKGIRVIHVFSYEWENKTDIIKSIISSALNLYEKTIYARNCIVKEISSNEYKEFLELNHLQGSVNSSIRFGLYTKENELVSVIGFGKSRFKKDEIELHRFCTKLNYKVIGGFSKLIKASNQHNFISYIDLSHFSGKGYEKIGFSKISLTEPSYVWIKNEEVLSRQQTQKHKLQNLLDENYNSELSETDNMIINGYLQIFNSGNLKVKYNK